MLLFWKQPALKRGTKEGSKRRNQYECRGQIHFKLDGTGEILKSDKFEHNIKNYRQYCEDCAHIAAMTQNMKKSAKKRIENGRFCGYEPGLAKYLISEVVKKKEWICQYSGKEMKPNRTNSEFTLSVDRINPKGSYEKENVVCVRLDINKFKGKYIDNLILSQNHDIKEIASYINDLADRIINEGEGFTVDEKFNNLDENVKSNLINNPQYKKEGTIIILQNISKFLLQGNAESSMAIEAQRFAWLLEENIKQLQGLVGSDLKSSPVYFVTKQDLNIIKNKLTEFSDINKRLEEVIDTAVTITEMNEEMIEFEEELERQIELQNELEQELVEKEIEYLEQEELEFEIMLAKALEEVAEDVQKGFS
ncbi:hypothetical protein IIM_00495 [Bacillus cereus VD107]|uniref:hypothetical protein n=1 Tax=unclassified Bacillus cereus group TaxID=2750818 RepID=UPI000279FDB2|nr:hypothetical protein IIM_00495 [Bacillus cereus VD107]